jgi:hypothetical protein
VIRPNFTTLEFVSFEVHNAFAGLAYGGIKCLSQGQSPKARASFVRIAGRFMR